MTTQVSDEQKLQEIRDNAAAARDAREDQAATGPRLVLDKYGSGIQRDPPPPETVRVDSTVPVTTGLIPSFLLGPIKSTTQYLGGAWKNFDQALSILSEYTAVGLEGLRKVRGAETGYGLPIFNLKSQPPPGTFTGEAIDPMTGHPIPRVRPLHPRGFGTDLEQGQGLLGRQERTKRAEESAKLFKELFYAALDRDKKAEIRAKIHAAYGDRSFWEKVTLGLFSPENLLFLGTSASKAFKEAAQAFSSPVIITAASGNPVVKKFVGILKEISPSAYKVADEQSKAFSRGLGRQLSEAERLRGLGVGEFPAHIQSRKQLARFTDKEPLLPILEENVLPFHTVPPARKVVDPARMTVPTEGATVVDPGGGLPLRPARRTVPTEGATWENFDQARGSVDEVKGFLQQFGNSPMDDLSIGAVEQTRQGTRQFILGSFNDTVSGQRVYIKYQPSTNTFSAEFSRKAFRRPLSYSGDEVEIFYNIYEDIYGAHIATTTGKPMAKTVAAASEPSIARAVAKKVEEVREAAQRITAEDADELVRLARIHNMNNTEQFNNVDALVRLFLSNEPPQLRDMERLEEIFGSELVTEMARIFGVGPDMWDRAMDILNIPRALWTSNDLSAIFRQSRLLGNGNPKEWQAAVAAGAKAMASERNARAIQESIEQNPMYDLLQGSGVQITKRGGIATKLTDREEAFMSSLASRIPWVRASERAQGTQLNKLRADVFYKIAADWLEQGKTFATHEADFRALGQYINWTTGRGPWPSRFNALLPAMNAIFFSPRLNTSRAAIPALLLKPAVRGLIAKDLLSFFTTNATILLLAEASGIATVAWDPRKKDFLSADFLKLQTGPTRVDFWGGNQQIAVLVGRLVMGEKKTAGGLYEGVPIQDTLQQPQRAVSSRFKFLMDALEYKVSPVVGIGQTLVTGKMPLGDPATPSNLVRELGPLFAGMAVGAIVEGIREGGWVGGVLGMPELVGIGSQSYRTMGQVKEEASQEEFGLGYNELTDEALNAKGFDLTAFQAKEKIDNDPKVLAYIDDMESRRGTPMEQLQDDMSPAQQLRVGLAQMFDRNLRLESDLRAELAKRLTGRQLRDAIRNFKVGRLHSFETAMTDEARERLDEASELSALSYYRNQFWEVQAKDVITEEGSFLDFDARDAAREEVVTRAAAAGISRESLEERPSDRFEDPEVQRVVEAYEGAMEWMRPYFDVARRHIPDNRLYAIYLNKPKGEWPTVLKLTARRITRERETMRRRLPVLRQLLKAWGFRSD